MVANSSLSPSWKGQNKEQQSLEDSDKIDGFSGRWISVEGGSEIYKYFECLWCDLPSCKIDSLYICIDAADACKTTLRGHN